MARTKPYAEFVLEARGDLRVFKQVSKAKDPSDKETIYEYSDGRDTVRFKMHPTRAFEFVVLAGDSKVARKLLNSWVMNGISNHGKPEADGPITIKEGLDLAPLPGRTTFVVNEDDAKFKAILATVFVAYGRGGRRMAEDMVDALRFFKPGLCCVTYPLGLRWRRHSTTELEMCESSPVGADLARSARRFRERMEELTNDDDK